MLTAKEIARLPNCQGAYTSRLPPPPDTTVDDGAATAVSRQHYLCVKNARTGRRTLFFRYCALYNGFIDPLKRLELEAGNLELEWVVRTPGTEPLFCTPFTLMGLRCVQSGAWGT
jgi:hypothetical protein